MNLKNARCNNKNNRNKNTEALMYASKDTWLDVNAYKTKYMVISRNQNARRIKNIKIDNISNV
jgi:hypothetical protein